MKKLSYEEALAFIHGRTQFKKILTLDRMRDFCKRLSDPQKNLKIIHVTGTNGKGSTTAIIRQILMENGFKVGSFTSPFIIKFNDRICINDKMISDDDLTRLVSQIKPVVAQMDCDWASRGGGPTEFEIDTAIMFQYFAEQKVDYAVLEVGLGGTYDSTNVITPLVSAITSVGTDHLKFLGPTLKDVARNKAGIIKPHIPVVVSSLLDDLSEVIQTRAEELDAPMFQIGKQIQIDQLDDHQWGEMFNYHFEDLNLNQVHLSLMGQYQISNAALAITAVQLVAQKEKWVLESKLIKQALEKISWPGRFEKVNDDPLTILDGAHNIEAVNQLAKLIQTRFSDRPVHLILAILADKQPDEMIATLAKLSNVKITMTTFASYRKLVDLNAIKQRFPQVNINENWKEAYLNIKRRIKNGTNDVIIFSGSLYFISEVRHFF